MSYGDEDLGQFNDSTVFFQPVHFNPKAVPTLAKHCNPQSINLGIYDSIKLSSLIENRSGQLIEFVTLDPRSNNTFVTNEALNLLERYSTDELCFLMVVGNRGTGKSFFCDKILNLSEIRGNHFCRKSNKGINIWSTPFQKDDLKIFLLEVSNCDINSQEFKILSTYALMIGSAFITVDSLKTTNKTAIEELDEVISDVVAKITPSQIERGEQASTNSAIFLPKLFYHLHRPSGYNAAGNLKMISFYANELLPDALEKTYTGTSKDLMHLPFLDTKCIKQEYIKRVATIFRDIYSKISQKRYKQLVLNGNIIAKVIKYIETYLNNRSNLNIDDLYVRVIEDLYQSAYNYCILSYHEDMQHQFEDQNPKPFDELLQIFERISDSTLEKFQEFNLDEKLFHLYYQKLQRHIDEKEQMILQINGKKTQQTIIGAVEQDKLGNVEYYRTLMGIIDKNYKHLDHRKANILGKINSKFYIKSENTNSVQFQVMKEIQALKTNVGKKRSELDAIVKINQQKALERSKANKEKEGYLTSLHAVQNKVKEINSQITKAVAAGNVDPSSQKEQERALTAAVAANNKIIQELKAKDSKDQRVVNLENRLEDISKKILMQEKLLKQLKESSNITEPVSKQKKGVQSSKKIQA